MSLFGDSPPPSTQQASSLKSSLFDDVSTSSPRQQSSTGLFADQPGSTGSHAAAQPSTPSTWDFQPTPKRAARSDLLKTLLADADVPDVYIDAFDGLIASTARASTASGASVSWTGVRRLLNAAPMVGEDDAARILTLVSPNGQNEGGGLGRAEFNVLMALVGLAQEGDEVSLDGVDERRRRLPQPDLPELAQIAPSTLNKQPLRAEEPPSRAQATPTKQQIPVRPQDTQERSGHSSAFSFPEQEDPWGSPGNTKASAPAQVVSTSAASGAGMNGMNSSMPGRTTSTFTASGDDLTIASEHDTLIGGGAEDWGVSGSSYGASSLADDGFGVPVSEDPTGGQTLNRPAGPLGGRSANNGVEEVVTVTSIPEKEGMFLFQYRNYEVASSRRGSKVVRRYSDFVWLLDCLHKKYPFRQLPLLPPKRVAINGRHIAADSLFIEKRRRGLARFVNALVRHPVLNSEQLVVMFLTVPTELSVWRKQASIQIQEEFTGRPLAPDLEDSLPRNLEELFATTRSGVRRSADSYIALCALLERLVKRKEGLSTEYARFSTTLASATESSNDTYAADNNDVPLLNEGLHATAKGISSSAALLSDENTAWDDGALEDLKRQRDTLVSMRDVFDRRDRLDRDTIPALEKRIQNNEGKLASVRAKPEGTRKVGEAEKLEESITKDKESIIAQHARSVFVKECIRDEIHTFQASLFHVSRFCQDWAAERVKYAELQADSWRALVEGVETMPTGE